MAEREELGQPGYGTSSREGQRQQEQDPWQRCPEWRVAAAATVVAVGAGTTTVAGARGASVGGAGLGLELPVGGRRRLLHSGPEAMSSACLHHGWVGEGEEMESMGGFRSDLELRGWGGGGGG